MAEMIASKESDIFTCINQANSTNPDGLMGDKIAGDIFSNRTGEI